MGSTSTRSCCTTAWPRLESWAAKLLSESIQNLLLFLCVDVIGRAARLIVEPIRSRLQFVTEFEGEETELQIGSYVQAGTKILVRFKSETREFRPGEKVVITMKDF